MFDLFASARQQVSEILLTGYAVAAGQLPFCVGMDLIQGCEKEGVGVCMSALYHSPRLQARTLLSVSLELRTCMPHGVKHCDGSVRRLVLIVELDVSSVIFTVALRTSSKARSISQHMHPLSRSSLTMPCGPMYGFPIDRPFDPLAQTCRLCLSERKYAFSKGLWMSACRTADKKHVWDRLSSGRRPFAISRDDMMTREDALTSTGASSDVKMDEVRRRSPRLVRSSFSPLSEYALLSAAIIRLFYSCLCQAEQRFERVWIDRIVAAGTEDGSCGGVDSFGLEDLP